MKYLLSTLVVCAVILTNAQDRYTQIMGTSIGKIFSSQTTDELTALANQFDRIGQAEATRWEPYYYAALTHVFHAMKLSDANQKDYQLDLAIASIEKAEKSSPENSEIVALNGFIRMISISVDPGTRGQTVSPKAFAMFEKAVVLNPDNPRATLFLGQMEYGTAQFFGSDTEVACGLVAKSIVLFESQDATGPIAPSWGYQSALQYQEMCKKPADTSPDN